MTYVSSSGEVEVECMETNIISSLFIEHDIPANIFAQLTPRDLLNAELVCHEWKLVIVKEKLWQKQLNSLYRRDSSWRYLLKQFSLKNRTLSHIFCKSIYMNVLSQIGPSRISGKFAKFMLNDFFYDDVQNLPVFKDFEESLYVKEGILRNRKQLIEMATSGNDTIFINEGFRELVLTGPTAFPVIVTPKSSVVVVAASTFGRGRLVVLGHEALLKETSFIQQLADWCGGRTKCQITEDVTEGFWRNGWKTQTSNVKKPRRSLSRKQLNNHDVSDIGVYITDAHYDEDWESLIEYVKRGGGLIIAGHASWQLSQLPNHCDLLEHPGNRITAPMGIVFSSTTYVSVSCLNLTRGTLPGLKYSLYYVLKCISRVGLPLVRNFITTSEYKNLSNQVREIVKWHYRISKVEHFKDLLKYVDYYQSEYKLLQSIHIPYIFR